MSNCVVCSNSDGQTVDHHTSYENNETVEVCKSCHGEIHSDPDHELYPNGVREKTHISVSRETLDRIKDSMGNHPTYDDFLQYLLPKGEVGLSRDYGSVTVDDPEVYRTGVPVGTDGCVSAGTELAGERVTVTIEVEDNE